MRETLAQYVARIMHEKHLSGYEVERRSRKQISQSHVNRIKNGEVTDPSPDKLIGLSKGLGVPEGELFAVVRGMGGPIAHERLASLDFAYQGMPKKKKQKVDYIIDLLEREIERIKNEPAE